MTSMRPERSSGRTMGIYFCALDSTQPWSALVMIVVCPTAHAFSSSCFTDSPVRASSRRASHDIGTPLPLNPATKEDGNSVSSQSKITTFLSRSSSEGSAPAAAVLPCSDSAERGESVHGDVEGESSADRGSGFGVVAVASAVPGRHSVRCVVLL